MIDTIEKQKKVMFEFCKYLAINYEGAIDGTFYKPIKFSTCYLTPEELYNMWIELPFVEELINNICNE